MTDIVLKELIDDANEIRQLIERSERSNVKAKLIVLVKEVEEQIAKRRATEKRQENSSVLKRTYEIKNYAWDQSDKFVKIYLTLSGVETMSASDVSISYNNETLVVSVVNFKGNNYEFSVKKLLRDIVVADSSVKLKKDTVLVMLKKKEPVNWACLTQVESMLKEKQDSKMKPKMGDNKEPGDGLMDIMKQMYETGDDEMKRTIAKAWTESRDKQARGDMM